MPARGEMWKRHTKEKNDCQNDCKKRKRWGGKEAGKRGGKRIEGGETK
jgi:hypothetical protein